MINKNSRKGLSSVWILAIIGFVVILSGIVFVVSRQKSNTEPDRITLNVNNDSSTTISIQSPNEGESSAVNKAQTRYQTYTPSAFAAAQDQKRVLYFHANWCPVCRPIDREFQEKADQIPTGVVVFKTDYDTESELKKKYAITYQHTFVQIDAAGNEVLKWNGGGLTEVISRVK